MASSYVRFGLGTPDPSILVLLTVFLRVRWRTGNNPTKIVNDPALLVACAPWRATEVVAKANDPAELVANAPVRGMIYGTENLPADDCAWAPVRGKMA